MRLTVTSALAGANWAATGDDRLAQNVANLIRCYMSEVPFYRDLGVDGALIHRPLSEGMDELQGQIEEMLDEYAEGVTIDDIRVISGTGLDGVVIQVDLSDGEEEEMADE